MVHFIGHCVGFFLTKMGFS